MMSVVLCTAYAESTDWDTARKTVCELPAWCVLAGSLAHHVVGFHNVQLFPGQSIYILVSTMLDD